MSVRSSFSWHIGEDLLFTFTATSVTPITGWHFSFVLSETQGGTVILTKTSAVITDATNGVFTVALTAAETTLAARRPTWFQVRRTDSGDNTVLAEGPVSVTA